MEDKETESPFEIEKEEKVDSDELTIIKQPTDHLMEAIVSPLPEQPIKA